MWVNHLPAIPIITDGATVWRTVSPVKMTFVEVATRTFCCGFWVLFGLGCREMCGFQTVFAEIRREYDEISIGI